MKITKVQVKKSLGYLFATIVLVFLGEDFLQGMREVVGAGIQSPPASETPAEENPRPRYQETW